MKSPIAASLWAVAMVSVATTALAGEKIRSATEFLSPAMRAEQADPDRNPAMLWVGEGERLWSRMAGKSGRSCAGCHGDARKSMRGVAARYPMVDDKRGDLLNLELRINRCRVDHQEADALGYESQDLLSLTAFVASLSRGMPVAVETKGKAAPYIAKARQVWRERQGQLNLACAQCHQDNVGRRLRGDTISSGTGTAYPAYRLAWQSLGSLHRRLNDCQRGVRATMLNPGSPEHLALELFLAARANGKTFEAPGLRK